MTPQPQRPDRSRSDVVAALRTSEMEVFYTFTWPPSSGWRSERPPSVRGWTSGRAGDRSRGDGAQPRKEGGQSRGEGGAPRSEGGASRGEGGKPRGKGGKPQRGKGGKPVREDDGPKTFTARPERKADRIDPDNPFAQALAGLRTKT